MTSLRDRIQSGAISGGSPVLVVEEAQRLKLSTTPVREALARLSGEGLVVRAPSGGYLALRLDAPDLADRYSIRRQYLGFAIESQLSALGALTRPAPCFDPASPVDCLATLFQALIDGVGNAHLEQVYGRLVLQLRRPRNAETLLFSDLVSESREIFQAYELKSPADFLGLVDLYHRRRINAAAAIASLINDPSASGR